MSKLPNYLRSHRKRLMLSQAEVSFLLGAHGGAKTSRYEGFKQVPTLETALAFEAMFQRPVSELFAGMYESVERDVTARAKTLAHKTNRRKTPQQIEHKRQLLTNIANKIKN
jgi:DNA-binding XRE family transcriptional regulator